MRIGIRARIGSLHAGAAGLKIEKWTCASLLLLLLIIALVASRWWSLFAGSQELAEIEAAGDPHNDGALTQTHDFGIVSPGTTVEFPYVIHNRSQFDWHVLEVLPQCSCSAAEPSSRLIQPGLELILRVAIKVGDEERDLQRSVSVRIKQDSAERRLEFVALASVRHAVSVSIAPTTLRFVEMGESKSTELIVSNYSPKRWESVEVTQLTDSEIVQHDSARTTLLSLNSMPDRLDQPTRSPSEVRVTSQCCVQGELVRRRFRYEL